MDLRNFSETRLEALSGFVLHTPVLDEGHEVVLPVLANGPPKVVDVTVKFEFARRCDLVTEKLLHCVLEIV
jgi:hypothetical protein